MKQAEAEWRQATSAAGAEEIAVPKDEAEMRLMLHPNSQGMSQKARQMSAIIEKVAQEGPDPRADEELARAVKELSWVDAVKIRGYFSDKWDGHSGTFEDRANALAGRVVRKWAEYRINVLVSHKYSETIDEAIKIAETAILWEVLGMSNNLLPVAKSLAKGEKEVIHTGDAFVEYTTLQEDILRRISQAHQAIRASAERIIEMIHKISLEEQAKANDASVRLGIAARAEKIPQLAEDLQIFSQRPLPPAAAERNAIILLDLTMPAGELLLPYLPEGVWAVAEGSTTAIQSAPDRPIPWDRVILEGRDFSKAVQEVVRRGGGRPVRLLTRRSGEELAGMGLTGISSLTPQSVSLEQILEVLWLNDQDRKDFIGLFAQAQANWEGLQKYL